MRSARLFLNFFPQDIHNDHRCLRVHTTIYTLAVATTPVLLMLLIWHTSTIHVVEKFDMPHIWEVDFVKQQLTGMKRELWIIVFILVPIDLVHALLCLDYYHGRTHTISKRDDRSIRTHTKKQTIIAEDEVQERSDIGGLGSQTKTTLSPRHVVPHTYHPFFRATTGLKTPLLLLTLYDTMQITLLSLHIFSYFSNITPSIAFCSTPGVLHYPNWAFHHHSTDWRKGSERPPQLSMKARCERINWNIHVAGGFSAAVAAILATLHACAVGLRVWHCLTRAWRKHSPQIRTFDMGSREVDEEAELEDWHYPPRDVDINIGPQPPPTDRSNPPQTQPASRPATISEEERRTGAIRQQRRRLSKSKSSSARARLVALEEAKWAEALLECLVP